MNDNEQNRFSDLFSKEILKRFDLQNEDITDKFYIYYRHLTKTNKKINLTAITELEEVITKHFADSLLPLKNDSIPHNAVCADIGTGAGFPGLPIAMCRPDIKMFLVDSLKKRVNFLDEVISLTQTENCVTVHARAEDLAKQDHREKYDIVLSRAVSNLATLSELCLPLVKLGGKMIALKSRSAESELEEARNAMNLLGGSLETVYGSKERNLVIITKVKQTPVIYPRKAGTPEKYPLT